MGGKKKYININTITSFKQHTAQYKLTKATNTNTGSKTVPVLSQ